MSAVSIDLVDSDDDSIIMLAAPLKPTPVVVEVDVEEEIVLNVSTTSAILTPSKPVNVIIRDQTPKRKHDDNADDASANDVVSPYHWTKDMKTYYNDDWAGEENFTLEKLLSKMPIERKFWHVTKPLMPSPQSLACFKCNEFHKRKTCRSTSCFMCGIEGHVSTSCPHKMCLSCGKKTKAFIVCCEFCKRKKNMKCYRCSVYGHSIIDCTDNWRRFHNITSKTNIVVPDVPAEKPMQELWCCNCARQGHLEHSCNGHRDNIYPGSSTIVSSYDYKFNIEDFRKRLESKSLSHSTKRIRCRKRKRYFDVETEENPQTKKQKINDGTSNSTGNAQPMHSNELQVALNAKVPNTVVQNRILSDSSAPAFISLEIKKRKRRHRKSMKQKNKEENVDKNEIMILESPKPSGGEPKKGFVRRQKERIMRQRRERLENGHYKEPQLRPLESKPHFQTKYSESQPRPPPLLSLPFHPPSGAPSHQIRNPNQAGHQRKAVQHWTDFLLGN